MSPHLGGHELIVFEFSFCDSRTGSPPLISKSPWTVWTPSVTKFLATHKYWNRISMELLMWPLVPDANVTVIPANVLPALVRFHWVCGCFEGVSWKTFTVSGLNGERTRVCECKHFTDGPDCEKCLPFYNDAPWGRATSKNVHECKRKYIQTIIFPSFTSPIGRRPVRNETKNVNQPEI